MLRHKMVRLRGLGKVKGVDVLFALVHNLCVGLGSVDISKIGVLKQSLRIVRANCNPLIQQVFLPNVNRT